MKPRSKVSADIGGGGGESIAVYASDGTGTLRKQLAKSTSPRLTNKSVAKPGLVISVHSRTLCKDGLIAFIPLFYVSLTDKGQKTGVHPYNRILART